MKHLPALRSIVLATALSVYSCAGLAEDVDLFANAAPAGAAGRPNILIVIDSSANWSRNDQAWPTGKQGQAELNALRRLMDDPSIANVNIGLMLFTAGTGSNYNGGYVRFHVRPMNNPANRAALKELIGDSTCVNGPNSLNGTPNCLYNNYDSPSEKVGTAKTDYSGALFDVFKYFGGFTNPANARTDIAGAPIDQLHYGALRYSGDPDSKSDPAAYAGGASKPNTVSPIDSTCAQNAIIFIGNGFPTNDAPASLLTGIGGSTTQLLMPTPSGTFVTPTGSKIRYADEWAKYLFSTDVHSTPGQQNVKVYTVDVYNAKPDADQNSLLMSMAKHGGGQYVAAKSEDEILQAFKDVLIDVQSVDSVFTSSSVPINATNRTQFLNQVYIGMFRPDPDSRPRWYGNLKRYQVGNINGEIKLTDKNNDPAIAASTGFLQSCAISYWTTDSGAYWDFSPSSAGQCSKIPGSAFSDLPDADSAEKGGAAEVLRRGNDPTTPTTNVNRTVYTCTSPASCASLVAFNSANVSTGALGVATAAEQTRIIDHTLGKDVNDENGNGIVNETRASIHGDVVHSQPLPVSYGGATGVVLFYGANDGTFRAVSGNTGKELWAFVAPEHHSKLKRLADDTPQVYYPGMPAGVLPVPQRKDYFFDGTAALFQTADNSKIWIFPTMRRGGRMLYAFDVTTPTAPTLKWRVGCPNTANDTGCTAGFTNIGQTWSTPRVAKVKGYNGGNSPIIIMGGGYDACEDADSSAPSCAGTKGNRVYVIDADTGTQLAVFNTTRSVAADVSLVDRDGDAYVDHAYVADTGGALYRIDFSDPSSLAPRASPSWSMTQVAQTTGAGRKFLEAPGVLATKTRVYVAIGSGDREEPLQTQYPYSESIMNRFYLFIDKFSGASVNLDGASMANFTATPSCDAKLLSTQDGWYIDLNNGRGEQTVTGGLIFGGIIYFSTNRALPPTPNTCSPNLGEARGYAVNLLNASGAVGTQAICGGSRSGIFTGGGIPPTPVTATLPVNGPGGTKNVSVLFGGVQRSGSDSCAVCAQRVTPTISGKRTRSYWYTKGNK